MVLWGMGLQRSTVWVVGPMLKWDVGNDLFFVRTPLWNRIRRVGVLEHEGLVVSLEHEQNPSIGRVLTRSKVFRHSGVDETKKYTVSM